MFVVLCVVTALTPQMALAQFREIELRRVIVDHDEDTNFITTHGERIPPGWGITARVPFGSGPLLQLEFSAGIDSRTGVVCGGFIQDPARECIVERVAYSGGLAAISFGWRARTIPQPRWSGGGVLPHVGFGAAWMREAGQETGRSMSEARLALIGGLGGEVGYLLPDRGITVHASVGPDLLKPIRVERSEDCSVRIRDTLPQYFFGLGASWRR
jgi:hypothetical protein